MKQVNNGYAEKGLYEYGQTKAQALDKLKETLSKKSIHNNYEFIILRES